LLASCADLGYEADVGRITPDADTPGDGNTTNDPGCTDGDPMASVSFAGEIRPLLGRQGTACTGCHGTAQTSGFSVVTYERLRAGGQLSGTRIIQPGKPCESILLQKLGPAPPYGTRMPYSGPPYLSSTDRALIRDWIAEGALNN
jgi:hypothetical protein